MQSTALSKAKVEVTVQVVQRWVLARLRNRVFHTLAALNEAIRESLADLNRRRMREYGKSRLELFEAIERAALLPLPADSYELTEWKKATVDIDYHVAFGDRLYSVPHRYLGEEVWICAIASMVEVHCAAGGSLCTHVTAAIGTRPFASTCRALIDSTRNGRRHASCRGPADRAHRPERCVARSSLTGRIPSRASARAWAFCAWPRSTATRRVESVLRLGLDSQPMVDVQASQAPVDHENVRGPDYFVN